MAKRVQINKELERKINKLISYYEVQHGIKLSYPQAIRLLAKEYEKANKII